MFGVSINFGYRTFKWSNEAKGKAAVHCVIIGFDTVGDINSLRFIFDEEGERHIAQNITPYLLNTPHCIVERRTEPLCDVPLMLSGSKAADGGHLILSEAEYIEFVEKEPLALKYIKKFSMGVEFINNTNRYCLWLVDCSPAELRKMPLVMEHVRGVKEFREASKKEATRKKASTPTLFDDTRCPTENYIAIPQVSSQTREYIPMGFLTPETIAGNKLFVLRSSSLYYFGLLTSKIHMAWVGAVAGRMKSDYSYSNVVVYNTFPFPTPTDEQKSTIEKTAQGILDARALYPDSSLADLYDPLTMPPELRKAHEANDKAVEKAYGKKFGDEMEIVMYLMNEYLRILNEKK